MKAPETFTKAAPQRQFSLEAGLSTPRLPDYSEYLSKKPKLLSDEEIQHFLASGCLSLQPSLPPAFHERVFRKIDDVVGNGNEEDNPGNNFLPLVPEIGLVFKDPVIAGALLSILGPNYMMHPHRAIHDNPPGSGGQPWHHDTYWGYLRKVRCHRPWWVMVMYMPQPTSVERGPTGVLPGSQYLHKRVSHPEKYEVPNAGPGGHCMIIHYDIWHHKMENFTKLGRYMAKFEFVRCEKPSTIHWISNNSAWRHLENQVPYGLTPLWKESWRWLRNGSPSFETPTNGTVRDLCNKLKSHDSTERLIASEHLGSLGPNANFAADALGEALHDDHEPVAINSAYALGALGASGVSILNNEIKNNDGSNDSDPRIFFDEGQEWNIGHVVRTATHGLISSGTMALPELLEFTYKGDGLSRRYAAFALGELAIESREIEAALSCLCQDSDTFVRVSATEALGISISSRDKAVSSLCSALTNDPDDETRSHAALALWRLGPRAHRAIPSLIKALYDGDRYVQGYTLEALQRIGTPEAINAALENLRSSRWCSITNNRSMF